jgi:tRNA pseudouridine13 synthase
VPFHTGLDPARREELAALTLPLPSSRLKLATDDPHAELVRSIVAEEGLELSDLQVKGIREMFFSRGERAALCMPHALAGTFAPDDHHAGKYKLTLTFELERGCYATLLVKALMSGEESS